jgi:cation diffusion facilitator family transporter
MKSCCEAKSEALVALRGKQRRVLQTVLAINATMFVVELVAGLLTRSTSVLADSLDMFGDAVVYASSLYVLSQGARARARVATLKGAIMVLFGVGVLAEAVTKAISGRVPIAEGMGLVGGAALVANLVCLALLLRHRDDDINMRSTWICSRNDIIANVGVLAAAGAVALSGSRWPDVLVGAAIAGLFLWSAFGVLREARLAYHGARHSG